MASCGYLVLTNPNQAHEWQQSRTNVQHGTGRLIRGRWVHNSNAAVMTSKCQSITTRGKGTAMDPSSRIVQVFSTVGVEGNPLTPNTGFRALVNSLDVTRKHSAVRVCRAGCEEDGVGVPCKGSNGTSNWLLQVFRNPPVILLFKVTHCNNAGA